jgi:hypothetical protein
MGVTTRSILICFFSFYVLGLSAQEMDTQGWFGVDVSKSFGEKIVAGLATQRRYENNISTFIGSYHSAQLRYEIIKGLYIRPSLRLTVKEDGNTWRYGLELYKRFRINKYSLDVSQQAYRNFEKWGSTNDDSDDQYDWRSELTNKYRFTKKLSTSAGAVLFVAFKNDPVDITRLRLRGEVAYDITKNINLALGVIRQYDYKKSNAIKRELWIPRVDLGLSF